MTDLPEILLTVALVLTALAWAFAFTLDTYPPGSRGRHLRPCLLTAASAALAAITTIIFGWTFTVALAVALGVIAFLLRHLDRAEAWLTTPHADRSHHPATPRTHPRETV